MDVRIRRWMCLGMLLLVGVGCAEAEVGDETALNHVRGKITFQGKNLPTGSIVTFHPKSGPVAGQLVSGQYSDEDSFYSINTSKDGETVAGAPEGEYDITVEPPKKSRLALPAKYAKPATSGLSIEVKKGMNNAPDVVLVP